METVRRVNPELCYDFLFPKPGETYHSVEYLPNDLVIREMTIMAEVIRSAATSHRKPPAEKEIEPQLFRIVMQLSGTFGNDALLLTAPMQSNVDKARICEMSLVFYQKMLELPDREAAPLVRYLFANSQRD